MHDHSKKKYNIGMCPQFKTMERLICLIGLFFRSFFSNGIPFCTKEKSSCTKSRSLSTFKRLLLSNCKSSCTFRGCHAENIYRYWQKASGLVHFTDRCAQTISGCGQKNELFCTLQVVKLEKYVVMGKRQTVEYGLQVVVLKL